MPKIVAITVEKKGGLDVPLDGRFGRAPFFLIVDFNSKEIVGEIKNLSSEAAHGAGTGSAAVMAQNSVDSVISGRYGPKAYQALEQLGIQMWVAPEGISASTALEKLACGDLKQMEVKVY